MKTTQKYFAKPDCKIQISNIVINQNDYSFSLTLGTKEGRQKLFRERTITGKVHKELMDWFTKLRNVKVPVEQDGKIVMVPTGDKRTGFEKFIIKNGLDFDGLVTESEKLNALVFTCDNKSDSYVDCPFKVVEHDNGATLTLVNIKSKIRKQVKNMNTGQIETKYLDSTYVDKDGVLRRSYVSPDYYIRYIHVAYRTIEVATPEQIANAQ